MQLIGLDHIRDYFRGKRVVVVGSGPGCLDNTGAVIEQYDAIIRLNNFKVKGLEHRLGQRVDVHYSFYGKNVVTDFNGMEGIAFHMCKCPNDAPFTDEQTAWRRHHEPGWVGYDFRHIYQARAGQWIAPVYIPTSKHFLDCFNLVSGTPTTGFMCLWELVQCSPKELYITGFDFFESKIHNVDEIWSATLLGNVQNCLRHRPENEKEAVRAWTRLPFVTLDKTLRRMFDC